MLGFNLSLWGVVLAGLVAYALYGAFWRLYLSPIAHIPGPRLAAMTLLYEMYYDTWLGGKYEFKIIEMHKKYGPIIRISPWELRKKQSRFASLDFYDTIYVGHSAPRRSEKYYNLVRYFGLDLCVFSTIDHDVHRMRRNALNPFFSTTAVRSLQPVMQERNDVVQMRMKEFMNSGKVLNASNMLAAFTNDIVETYCFARCQHRIEHPDFDPRSRAAAFEGATSVHIMKHIWWVYDIMNYFPTAFVKALHHGAGLYLEQKRESRAAVEKIIHGENTDWRERDQPTIFRAALEAKVPDHEKSLGSRLTHYFVMEVMAGTLTTAMTLETIVYWLVAQPDTLRKLKEELKTVMPDVSDVGSVPLAVLENLPYLQAVVKEGLRLSYGSSMRLQRIDPDNPILFTDKNTGKEWVIPAKTPVGMSAVGIHHDESIFQDSKAFRPERWLGPDGKRREKYLVSFSRGSRNCLGMNLSYSELALFSANMWRTWTSKEVEPIGGEAGTLELYQTTVRDVEIEGDYYIPVAQKGSKGIQLIVRPFKA
ncbi:cytochrome P450 [Xylariaceae sp. FL1272]|nr:cytochrome P450 [Xylariaceae sp. FL1272]